MSIDKVVLATQNPNKVRELRNLIGNIEVISRPDFIGEIEETGETILENALLKAQVVAKLTGLPALSDDTGLEVEYLNGEPGVKSARYAGEDSTDEDNVIKVLNLLSGVKERRARFFTAVVLSTPDGSEFVGQGWIEGRISEEMRGLNGFGYDAIFIPDEGDGRTFGEMTPDEKNSMSHRFKATLDLINQGAFR